MPILRLAMPTPLRRHFDYLPPKGLEDETCAQLQPGCRVLAPFGPRKLVGILIEVCAESDLEISKLRPCVAVLDRQPAISQEMMALCQWAANYYLHPLGDVLSNALPVLLRRAEPAAEATETRWQLTVEGRGLPEGALKRAPKQAQALALLQSQAHIGSAEINAAELARSHFKTLQQKGLAESIEVEQTAAGIKGAGSESPLALNDEQRIAFDSIDPQTYSCSLLEGITGSGKTEVYLQLIARCLEQGQQALVLIPEIGLTPQTLSRFQRRFDCPIAVLHSGLSDRERLNAWRQAAKGSANIIIGTRSAVFTPMAKPGLLIIDEEHDTSFKQQDGFRYSARDIAIKRAFDGAFPILLGSATPSLETLHNALSGRYRHLKMQRRATGATPPPFQLVDIRNSPLQHGFSEPLLEAINDTVAQGNQALVFINRRGFAPILMCHSCGHVAQCHHCDARLTVHMGSRALRCHHCESQWALPKHCGDCGSGDIDFRGSGTERSEQALQQWFPNTDVYRIDRDTTGRKQAMQELVDEVHRGQPCILVGTQMLAKGHHFPDVTLVAILDADGGLFSADFRGPEKMGQLLIQVAGRAGRESKAGRVLLQTHQPEHPLMQYIAAHDYPQFARQLLSEREVSGLPPFGFLALLRADHNQLAPAEQLLRDMRHYAQQQAPFESSGVQCFGPLPAPMARKAGRFRAQLLLQANSRQSLHQQLRLIIHCGDHHPLAKRVRWSIDVDPADMF